MKMTNDAVAGENDDNNNNTKSKIIKYLGENYNEKNIYWGACP